MNITKLHSKCDRCIYGVNETTINLAISWLFLSHCNKLSKVIPTQQLTVAREKRSGNIDNGAGSILSILAEDHTGVDAGVSFSGSAHHNRWPLPSLLKPHTTAVVKLCPILKPHIGNGELITTATEREGLSLKGVCVSGFEKEEHYSIAWKGTRTEGGGGRDRRRGRSKTLSDKTAHVGYILPQHAGSSNNYVQKASHLSYCTQANWSSAWPLR